MEKVEDRTDVIFKLLRKRQGFAAQAAHSLPKGVVETFDMIGLTGFLAASFVPFRWQDSGVRLPEVGKANRALSIVGRERRPELSSGLT